nr:photosystem II protein D1 - Prochlorococcus marinus (fragments) [Prochlorococcus marinus]
MTTIRQQRSSLLKGWPQFCEWVTSTDNRPLDLAAAESTSVALVAPSIG